MFKLYFFPNGIGAEYDSLGNAIHGAIESLKANSLITAVEIRPNNSPEPNNNYKLGLDGSTYVTRARVGHFNVH